MVFTTSPVCELDGNSEEEEGASLEDGSKGAELSCGLELLSGREELSSPWPPKKLHPITEDDNTIKAVASTANFNFFKTFKPVGN